MATPSYIVSSRNCIYEHLAIEQTLLCKGSSHLFLWKNDKAVVIGKNQDAIRETSTGLNNSGIKLARRHTGGGAVYHDLGNSCFSMIFSKRAINHLGGETRSVENAQSLLEKTMRDHFGLKSFTRNYRNDFTIIDKDEKVEKKVSGTAMTLNNKNQSMLYHGTMLINLNMRDCQMALTPHKIKLEKKGIASVAARVCNLNTVVDSDIKPISHESFTNALIKECIKSPIGDVLNEALEFSSHSLKWLEEDSRKFCYSVDETGLTRDPIYQKYYEDLTNEQWIWGTHMMNSKRYPAVYVPNHGLFELALSNGDIIVYTDCLDVIFIEYLSNILLQFGSGDSLHSSPLLLGTEKYRDQAIEVLQTIIDNLKLTEHDPVMEIINKTLKTLL